VAARHNWVRHTMQQIEVVQDSAASGGFRIFLKDGGDIREAVGCDDCGLPLTAELFEEPCLSELMDQMDKPPDSGEDDD
jgi:hypothetical protein